MSADTCLLFITGPGSRHNCGINATQIILLFHKVFIMNHSQIHLIRKMILFTYMFCNYLVTPLCQKESKKKKKKAKCVPLQTCSAVLLLNFNLLIYLVVRCCHPARERGQGALAWPPKIKLHFAYVSVISSNCSFPHLPHYQPSPSKT